MRLNALHLKIIALTLMFIEHFGRFLPSAMPAHYPSYFLYTGRIVAPIFFFLAVESYFKTRRRRAYITRLFVWAGIMALGNYVVYRVVRALYEQDFAPWNERVNPVGFNILFSLAVGVSLVAVLEWTRIQSGWKKASGGLGALALVYAGWNAEYSNLGVAMILVFYVFYNRKPWLYIAYALLCLAVFVQGWIESSGHIWPGECQWAMIAALPFFMLYNGERGRPSLKYLFYVFYPLHVWALYYLSYATTL
jgi:hypothetical protein